MAVPARLFKISVSRIPRVVVGCNSELRGVTSHLKTKSFTSVTNLLEFCGLPGVLRWLHEHECLFLYKHEHMSVY